MKQSTAREDLLRGIWKENPTLVQLLGMCPTLAITNTVTNGIAMGAATAFVLICSSIFVSSLRKVIPGPVRITAYVLIIATFVTIVDMVLQSAFPEIHKALGAFIALIVVNCIILGRQEAFAARNTVFRSALDAIGMSIGFTIALLMMSGIRELLGNGTLLNVRVMPDAFEPWVIMVLPPGGFFTLGFLLLGIGAWQKRSAAQPLRARPHPVTLRTDREVAVHG